MSDVLFVLTSWDVAGVLIGLGWGMVHLLLADIVT